MLFLNRFILCFFMRSIVQRRIPAIGGVPLTFADALRQEGTHSYRLQSPFPLNVVTQLTDQDLPSIPPFAIVREESRSYLEKEVMVVNPQCFGHPRRMRGFLKKLFSSDMLEHTLSPSKETLLSRLERLFDPRHISLHEPLPSVGFIANASAMADPQRFITLLSEKDIVSVFSRVKSMRSAEAKAMLTDAESKLVVDRRVTIWLFDQIFRSIESVAKQGPLIWQSEVSAST